MCFIGDGLNGNRLELDKIGSVLGTVVNNR